MTKNIAQNILDQIKYKYDRAAYYIFRKLYDEKMMRISRKTDHWILTQISECYDMIDE